jgi:hypothetical protein
MIEAGLVHLLRFHRERSYDEETISLIKYRDPDKGSGISAKNIHSY